MQKIVKCTLYGVMLLISFGENEQNGNGMLMVFHSFSEDAKHIYLEVCSGNSSRAVAQLGRASESASTA